MSLINSFTHIQENWKFVIICVQNQWGVVHPWHGTVANLWGRHKDFTEFNENFEKSYLLNGLSNIVKFFTVKFFTVWFLKIFCIKWIHIFFWVQCSFKTPWLNLPVLTDKTLARHSISFPVLWTCSCYTGWPRKNATILIVNFKNIVNETDFLFFYLVEHSFSNKMTPWSLILGKVSGS